MSFFRSHPGRLLMIATVLVIVGGIMMFAQPGWTLLTVAGAIVMWSGGGTSLYAAIISNRNRR